MKRITALAVAFVVGGIVLLIEKALMRITIGTAGLMLVCAGCGDGKNGEGHVCEQAFNKVKTCIASVDCTAVADTTEKHQCEGNKRMYSGDYGSFQNLCEQKSPGKCGCDEEDMRHTSEQLMKCELDPRTCWCDFPK
jgi:hypothetical protein